MNEIQSIVLEAIVCIVLSTAILGRALGFFQAAVVSTIKLTIPIVYFTVYGYETWALHDDVEYLRGAMALSRAGSWNPFTIFFNKQGNDLLFAVSQGDHIAYYWWNYLCNWIFGDFYWSPVLINVVFVSVAAVCLGKILKLGGHNRMYVKGATYFFLLFPELVIWSSFLNLKDSMILMLTVLCARCIAQFMAKKAIKRSAVILVAATVVLLYLRFYIPLLLVLTSGTWFVTSSIQRLKYAVFLVPFVPVVYFVFWTDMVSHSFALLDFTGAPFGAIRMILSPIPWSIEDKYGFLFAPSLITWMMAIPALVGAVRLWSRSDIARFAIIYLLLTFILYGAFPELQEPRHRVQVLWVITWLEFHGLWLWISTSSQNKPKQIKTATLKPGSR